MAKALVVEDTPSNLQLALEILKEGGFTAHGAENGVEALSKIERDEYDFVLMDIKLPGMSGVEAAKAIKSNTAYKDVPIIALTACAMRGDRERILSEGFDDYISKPIDIFEFMKQMEKYKK